MPEDEHRVIAKYEDSIPTNRDGDIFWQILEHPLGRLERKYYPQTLITTYKGVLPPAQGGAVNFAFLIHPLDETDFRRFLFSDPSDHLATERRVQNLIKWSRCMEPLTLGIVELSSGQRKCYGALICLFFLPDKYKDKDFQRYILEKQLEAFVLAESLGAGYVGLGAYNSINPRNIIQLRNQVRLPFTSGNSLTVDGTCESTRISSELFNIDKSFANIAIIGAYGNIGQYLSHSLIREFKHGFLIGPDYFKLIALQNQLQQDHIDNTTVVVANGAQDVLKLADYVVIAVSKRNDNHVIDVACLKPGTIVLDASVPQVLTEEQIQSRLDVLFLSSGIYLFPGDLFDCQDILRMGDKQEGFACLGETGARALGGQIDTVVGDIKPDEVNNIHSLAENLGFVPSGLRVMGHIPHKLTFEEIENFKTFLNGRRP